MNDRQSVVRLEPGIRLRLAARRVVAAIRNKARQDLELARLADVLDRATTDYERESRASRRV